MSQNDPLGLFEADNNDPLGLFSAEDAKPKKESLTDKAKKALGWNTGLALALPDAVQRDASIEPEVDQAKLMARRARREDVPEMTAESLGRDALSGALQIGPTAVKGVADIGRFLTGDRVGKDLSTQMDTGIKAIQNTIGSERGQAQRRNFEADMRDENVSAGELLGQNPGALADQVLPTVGSMFLPVGAGAAAGKVATMGSAVKGLSKAEVAARVAKAQEAAGIGTTAAQNAADTFSDLLEKGVSMEDAYKGAAITVPFTVIAGKLTGGGAETALTRAMTGTGAMKKGVVATAKAAGKEGAQETGEEIGQITGEAVGTGEAPTLNHAAKRMAVAGTLGAVVGGGANVAGTAPEMFQSQNTRALQELNDLVEGGEFSDAAPVAAARMTPAGSNHVLVAGMSIDRMSDAMLRRALNVVDDDERRLAIAGELKRRESVKTGESAPQPAGDNQEATLADQILALEGNGNAAEVDATGNQGQRSDGTGSYGNLQPMPGLDGRGGLNAGTPVAGGGANQSVGSPGGNNGAVGASVVDQSQLLNDVNGVTNAAVPEQVATQETQANDAQVGAKQAAAPLLTVPQQPTTTKPLEQTPVAMPIPKEIAARTATKTDAELALMAKTNSDPVVQEAVKQEQAKRKPKKDRKAVYPEFDSAMVAIAKLGGMDTQQLLTNGFDQSDISVQKGARVSKKTGQLGKAPFRAKQVGFNMPIHRNGGMSFDGMREALVQYGYLPEDASVNDAIELLRRELRGEPVYTASAVQAQAEAAEADRQAMMEAEQEANEASGYDELQGTAEERAADALIEELYGEEVAALARGMRVAGLTEEEINAEIEAFNQRTGAQDGAGQSQERSGEGRAEESGTDAEVFGGKEAGDPFGLGATESADPFGLEGQTNEEAAAEYKQQQAPEEISKEQIDREVDGFGLQQQSQPKPQGVQGGMFTADGRAAKDATVNAENVAKSEVTKPATKIADFGEKIGGAKKDVWTSHKDKLDDAAKLDIKVEPLSKSWPEPNYQSLIDAGADPFVVAFMRASRDAIPRKPTAKWKLKSWAGSVELLRDTSAKLLSGEIDANRAKELLQKAGDVSSNMRKIAGRIELYQLVGHRQSLDGVSLEFHHYTLYKGQENVSIWSIEKEAKATAFSNWPAEIVTGKTKTEVLEKFKEMYDKIDLNKKADRTVSFDLYSQGNKFYVGKKMGRNITQLAGPFDTVKEARAYRTDNQEELIARLEKAKEIPAVRRDTNNPRVGEDMRGGQDVTPELFAETFGFKGVEFGNWVEQKKRQKDLNDSFDALMDMAAIIGVPPKALSLNGELGLAFGARGSGGVDPAAAHYEPGKVVINLTKKEGAGSLGHEWWHALDNYFSRLRGKGGEFTTQALDVSLADRESQFIANTPVRKEMIEAFGAVMRAIRNTSLKARSSKLDAKRSKEYWTGKEEMSARAFESYLISKLQDQNASNDYLANIVDQDTWKAAESLGFELDDSYPYPTAGEMPLIREAFDRFFDTVQTKETERGVAMYSKGTTASTPLSQQTAERLIARELGSTTLAKVLVDSGIVSFVNRGSQFQGATFENGNIVLNLDALTEQNFAGVFKHEGFHSTVKELVGEETWNQLMSQLEQNLKMAEGNDWVTRANAAIPADTKASDRTEELAAYAIEQTTNGAKVPNFIKRWVDSLLSAIRTALIRGMGGEKAKLWAMKNLKPQDLANLAIAGLKAKARNELASQGRAAMAFSTAFGPESQHRTPLGDVTEIEVDGVKRPALNSNGKPIHWSREGVENFWRWFGDSRVVDEQGRPLVVYHGTTADIEAFDLKRSGEVGERFADAAFFTSSPTIAAGYAQRLSKDEEHSRLVGAEDALRSQYGKAVLEQFQATGKTAGEISDPIKAEYDAAVNARRARRAAVFNDEVTIGGANIVPVYLRIDQPVDIDAAGGFYFNTHQQAFDDAVDSGADGVVVRNVIDRANEVQGGVSDVFAVFDPTQIKSATGNNGDFDGSNPDIRYSKASPAQPAPLPEETKAQAAQRNAFSLPEWTKTDTVQERIQDRYNRIRDVVKAIRSQGLVNDLNNFDMGEDRFHGVAMAKIEAIEEDVLSLLKAAKAADITLEEATMYAYAEHAPERNKAMQAINQNVKTGSGMSDQEAADIIAKAKQEGKDAALSQIADNMRAITRRTLKAQLDAGLIEQSEYDNYTNKYQKWVPLRGFETIDEQGRTFRGTGKGFNIRGKENLRALGRDSKAGQILENIVMDAERTAIRSTKNVEVNHRFLRFVLDNPDPTLWEIDATKTKQALKNGRVSLDSLIDKGDNTIGVKVNGQVVYVKIHDQKLFEQLANMWDDSEFGAIPYLGEFSRYLSKSYTAWSPEFALYTNPIRDIQAAVFSITGREGVGMTKNFVKAYPKALKMAYQAEALGKDDPLYAEYKAMGGKTGFWNHNTLETKVKEIESLVKDMEASPGKNPLRYSFKMLKSLETLISNQAGAFENATRFAAYIAMRDAGRSKQDAAAFAKNLNVNFNRRGTWSAGIGSVVLFFNPAIQGIHNQYETLVKGKHKKQAWALMAAHFGAMAALAMLNAAGGEDDDGVKWWDKIPDYEKERNVILVLPSYMKTIGDKIPDSTGRYLKIPMPYQWNIGGYAGTLMADSYRNSENPAEGTSLGKAALLLSKATATAYMPVTGVPPTIAPIYHHVANKKPIGEGQLYPDSQFNKHKPDSEKYSARMKDTPWQQWAEFVNEATGGNKFKEGLISIPPAAWKNYVRNYLGGPMSFVNGIYDAVNDGDVTKAPFIRKAYGEVDFADDADKFYGSTKKPVEAAKAYKDALKSDPAYARTMRTTEAVMIKLGNMALNSQERLGAISKDDIRIKDRTDLSDSEKRLKLKMNDLKRSNIQEEYLKEQKRVLGAAAVN